MIKIARLIKSFLFPVRCPYCRKPIDYRDAACEECLHNYFGKVYKRKVNISENVSTTNIAVAAYDGQVREAICAYKFHGKKDYAYRFAILMAEIFKENYGKNNYDFITSVPLSKDRLKERGYNQAELMAREIAEEVNLPYREVLKKVKNNKTQHSLSMEDRQENVKNVYGILEKSIVKGARILICDDIITTGSTLAECTKELLKSGAKTVDLITFADTKLK